MKLFKHQIDVLESTEGENRVAIEGYEGLYEIDKEGTIYSISSTSSRRLGIMRPFINNSGYLRIGLFDNLGKRHVHYVHRLVAKTFIHNATPDTNKVVNHKDGNKLNNSVDNLEWCSQRENIKHSWVNGLQHGKGESHGMAKLKLTQVSEIRKNPQRLSQKELALKYGVAQCTISAILKKRIWKEGD